MRSKNTCVAVALASLAGGVVAAFAAPSGTTVPFGASHGDSPRFGAAAVVPLTSTSYLVAAKGTDNSTITADDEMLLVTNVDGTPVVTALATPRISDYLPRSCRMSATRVLVPTAGPDGDFDTADDGVYLLDGLGGAPTVTPLTVGGFSTGDGNSPTALSPSVAVVCNHGADMSSGSADDTIALLTDLGGTNDVQYLPAPYTGGNGEAQPTRLSDTSFLVRGQGTGGAANRQVFLFTDVGGTNTRTDLATPYVYGRAPGRPTRISATRGLVPGAGPDGNEGTADDVVFLLDGLGTTNTVTPLAVANLHRKGASVVVRLSDSLAVVATEGPDSNAETVDDTVVVLSDLGGTNSITAVTVGGLTDGRASRPTRLSATTCALSTAGPDGDFGGADDEVVVISDVGGANTVTRVTVPGLLNSVESHVVRLAPDAFLVTSAGDDIVAVVSDVFGTPVVESVALGPVSEQGTTPAFRAGLLGAGRAAVAHAGADTDLGTGLDDGVTVLSELPGPGELTTKIATFRFKENKPEKPQKIKLKGSLELGDVTLFGSSDLEVVIGNARQTIPAGDLVFNEKKQRYTYKDRKNVNGFIKSLRFDGKKGKLTVKGVDAGRPEAALIPISLSSDDVFFGVVVAGETRKSGVRYKAPR